jgi:predicted SAM-dependent methyltransferase
MAEHMEPARDDPFAGRAVPPAGLLNRLRFYGARNGYLYAVLSYAGRYSGTFWRMVAPLFTRGRISRWRRRPGPQIVNLGGGANVFDRWLTADVDARADVYVDLAKSLPFEDDSVDAIYLEEVIEHLPRKLAPGLIQECHRCLKDGGVLRLTTPDLDAYASTFDGTEQRADAINSIFYEHEHRHIYARTQLRRLLESGGFTGSRRPHFAKSRRVTGTSTPMRSGTRYPIELTQYWEAVKGG